jgi:hypothetical protein
MGIAPSYLMIELSFWLAERSARAGKNGPADTGYKSGANPAPAASNRAKTGNPNRMFWSGAVAKVPPPIGSVKYKAQPVVLSVQIPLFTGHSLKQAQEIRDLAVEVARDAQWPRILQGGE